MIFGFRGTPEMQVCILLVGTFAFGQLHWPWTSGVKVDDDSELRIGMYCCGVPPDCKQKFDRSALASVILDTRHSLPIGHAILPRA